MAKTEIARRGFIKAVGMGVGAVGLGVQSPRAASAAAKGTSKSASGGNEVDLYVLASPASTDANGRGLLTVTIGNYGPQATSGPATLRVVTPFYVNFVRAEIQNVPGCQYLFQDARPNVPEIVECVTKGPVEPGQTKTIQLPVQLLPNGPRVPAVGRAIIAAPDGDTEASLDQNTRGFDLIRPATSIGPGRPGTGGVNLFFMDETLTLLPDKGQPLRIRVGNAGMVATQRDATLTIRTPYYVNVDDKAELPAGSQMVYTNKNPAVPEILTVPVPAGLKPGAFHELRIPLISVAGAPTGIRKGAGIVVPDLSETSPDVDVDFNNNHHPFTLIML